MQRLGGVEPGAVLGRLVGAVGPDVVEGPVGQPLDEDVPDVAGPVRLGRERDDLARPAVGDVVEQQQLDPRRARRVEGEVDPLGVTVGPERFGRAGQQVLDRRHGTSGRWPRCRAGVNRRAVASQIPGRICHRPTAATCSFQRRVALVGDHEGQDNIHDDPRHDRPRRTWRARRGCGRGSGRSRGTGSSPPQTPKASGSCSTGRAAGRRACRSASVDGVRPSGGPEIQQPQCLHFSASAWISSAQ